MNEFFEKLGVVIFVMLIVAFFTIFFAFPVKWCWNYVMPYLFSLREITWGQAWCLSFLSSMLFKSHTSK